MAQEALQETKVRDTVLSCYVVKFSFRLVARPLAPPAAFLKCQIIPDSAGKADESRKRPAAEESFASPWIQLTRAAKQCRGADETVCPPSQPGNERAKKEQRRDTDRPAH